MHIANKVAQQGLAGTVCRMQVWIGVQDATDNEENVHWQWRVQEEHCRKLFQVLKENKIIGNNGCYNIFTDITEIFKSTWKVNLSKLKLHNENKTQNIIVYIR